MATVIVMRGARGREAMTKLPEAPVRLRLLEIVAILAMNWTKQAKAIQNRAVSRRRTISDSASLSFGFKGGLICCWEEFFWMFKELNFFVLFGAKLLKTK